jgi:DNA-binding transcriptional LysR family regulator
VPFLSPQSIEALAEIITGGAGNSTSPAIGHYRSAYYIERFMRSCNVEFALGGRSRVPAVVECLIDLNGLRSGHKVVFAERYVLMKRTINSENILADLQLLARVAEAGGMSAAASILGASKSSISTRISRLETSVGVRLLTRSRLGTKTTGAGQKLLQMTQRVQGDVEEALASVRADEREAVGNLKLSCPAGIADPLIVPLLADFLRKHPAVTLDIRATDDIIDPRQGGIDLAFRFGWLHGAESGLVARRIGTHRGIICVSPNHLSGIPPVTQPAHLLKLKWIGYSEFGGMTQRLKIRDPNGRTHSLELTANVRTSSALQVKSWAIEGLGATRLPEFLIRDDIASGRLVSVLPQYTFAEPSLFLLYARDRYRPMRLRVLISHLVNR